MPDQTQILDNVFLHDIEPVLLDKLRVGKGDSEKLAKRLFEISGSETKKNAKFYATFSLRTEGRSSVNVFELSFKNDSGNNEVAFVIRVYPDLKAVEEEQIAQKLTLSDCFPNLIRSELYNNFDKKFGHLVIYQHVNNNNGSENIHFNECLNILSNNSDKKINHFVVMVGNFIEELTDKYENIEKHKYTEIACSDFYKQILPQLPPDFIINGKSISQNKLYKNEVIIISYNNKNINPTVKDITLINQIDNSKHDWLKIKVNHTFDEESLIRGSGDIIYFPFIDNITNIHIWIGDEKSKFDVEYFHSFEEGKEYELIFFSKDIVKFTTKLEQNGFDQKSCISNTELKRLLEKESTVRLSKRHYDLHCGNILASEKSVKAIDIGDMRDDLLASDLARLETSTWYETAQLCEFSESDAKEILDNIYNNNFTKNELSLVSILTLVLRNLHDGFDDGVWQRPTSFERNLAYVIQILLYQRYFLLDGFPKISPTFKVFAESYIDKLRNPKKIQKDNKEYNIYVSYTDKERNWTDNFTNNLKNLLTSQSNNAFSFIEDYSEPIDILLIVLSPDYLLSAKEELATLLAKNPTEILIIDYGFTEILPTALENSTSYNFNVAEESSEYFQRLDDLVLELTNKINSTPTIIPTGKLSQYTVFLAEVSDDLEKQRDEVKRFLEQQGVQILPNQTYSFANIQKSIEQDLGECNLFVQLLSDKIDKYFPEFQYECANTEKIPILQWHPPTLDLNSISDLKRKNLLSKHTVIADNLAEFKEHIIDKLIPKSTTNSINNFVFVNAYKSDMDLAYQVGNFLVEKGITCSFPLNVSTTNKPSEIQQYLEHQLLRCDAVIVVYDETSVGWVSEKIIDCQYMLGKREKPFKTIAIYDSKPNIDRPFPDVRLPNVSQPILNCPTPQVDSCLPEFIRNLTHD
ncbi:hypothetical protein QUF50_07850 [Thiotrichales bacterium HSG1]|nr:hypothetical protein [Thiotrichales bacterium HSG1]